MNSKSKSISYMSKINGFFSLAIAKTGGSGITAVFWFIIAALLIPSEYGQIQYFISIAGIAYTISLIGTQEVITVYTAKKIDLQKTLISISLIVGTISGIVVLILFSKIDVSFLIIVFIINDIGLGYLLGKKFFKNYSRYFLTQKGLTFILGIGLYFVFGVDGIIFGLVLSYIHFSILIYKIIKTSKIDFPLLKTRLGFVTNNYLISIIGIGKNQLDKIIVLPIIGFELLGNYALALQMYAVFMMFSKIVYQYTLPEYDEAISAIQVISLAVIPATLSLIFSSKFLGQENARIILAGRIGFAGSFITSILVLTPIFGINGAASSFVIASILQCIILFIYLKIWRKRR